MQCFSDYRRYYLLEIMYFVQKIIAMTEIKIGNQIWMSHNLNIENFQNGEKITLIKSVNDWNDAIKNKIPACCDYNDDSRNGDLYGKIYNWFAINDSRLLAPLGWVIPTEKDWVLFSNTIGNNVGSKIKNSEFWDSNGTDDFGFSALPAGFRGAFGNFMDISKRTGWWSSSEFQPMSNKAWFASLDNVKDGENPMLRSFEILKADIRMSGYYVRCVKAS
jgi:uncharacterized protein (TIGR02145 family)